MQVRILTISEKHIEAARKITAQLKKAGVRAEEDFTDEKIGYKVRNAELQKVPYVFVLGDKELQENKVAVRKRGKQDLGAQDLDEFLVRLLKEIEDKI